MRIRKAPSIGFSRPSSDQVLIFKNDGGTFSGMYEAQSWLHKNGFSYGSTCVPCPYVAIQKGGYTLPQKFYNFDKEDVKHIDGVIYSLDYRNGDVEIWLKNIEPEIIVTKAEVERLKETVNDLRDTLDMSLNLKTVLDVPLHERLDSMRINPRDPQIAVDLGKDARGLQNGMLTYKE